MEQSLSNDRALTVTTLPQDRPEAESVLSALGRLFSAGASVDWRPVFDGMRPARVELPTYGFARQRYWLGGGEDLLIDPTRATLTRSTGYAGFPRPSSAGNWWSWCARTR